MSHRAAQQEAFNARHGQANNIVPGDIGATSWADFPAIELWQSKNRDPFTKKPLYVDGWFGSKSVRSYKATLQTAPVVNQIPIFGQM